MATATGETNMDTKIATLQREINATFDELKYALEKRRQYLLSRLSAVKAAREKNIELDEAIKQLEVAKENALSAMSSNLLKEVVDPIKAGFDYNIRLKEKNRMSVENVDLFQFRCMSDPIRKGIEETDLIELIPEYIGRENPILRKCSSGNANGQLDNPKGIVFDGEKNEVYIVDRGNQCVKVMSSNGDFLRSFGHGQMRAGFAVCLSKKEVFVTDHEAFLLKFNKSGKFLARAGIRSNHILGGFGSISGLCYDEGLVYVCDPSLQLVQIRDSNFKYLKYFGYGEITAPTDICVYDNTLYISSQSSNEIYCYSKDGHHQKTIPLVGQRIPMSNVINLVIDSKGNFLISDDSPSEIRIFSPNGVLKHSLGKGHLKFSTGIALDNTNAIICVNCGLTNDDCFQKY